MLALNRVPEGMEEMKRALVAEPDQPVALSALAHHAIISGNEPAAQSFLQRAQNQPRVARAEFDQLCAGFQEKFGRPFR